MKGLLFGILAFSVVAGIVQAQTTTREIALNSNGKIRITRTVISIAPPPVQTGRLPIVGVSPGPVPTGGSAEYYTLVATQLDDSNKAQVVSPARIATDAGYPPNVSFEDLTHSELRSLVSSTCATHRLDYLLMNGSPQVSEKMDATIFLLGVGRTRVSSTQEERLYRCSDQAVVLDFNGTVESSNGIWTTVLGGKVDANGGEANRVVAKDEADAIISMMSW